MRSEAVESVKAVAVAVERALDPWPLYEQGDLRWAAARVGLDAEAPTLSADGSAVTCAAMMATAVGCTATPAQLNGWLSRRGGYYGQPRTFLRWQKVEEFCALLEFVGQVDWDGLPANLDLVAKALETGPVIARVVGGYRGREKRRRFVVLLRWAGAGREEIEVADPRDGRRVLLTERYLDPSLAAPFGRLESVIRGMVVLQPRLWGGEDGEAQEKEMDPERNQTAGGADGVREGPGGAGESGDDQAVVGAE